MESNASPLRAPVTRASALHARASAGFAGKLEQAKALLRQAAALGPDADSVPQASSLGAEDVVITHLIAALGLPIPVFVLDTGALHGETLALLERTQARTPVAVYRPQGAALVQFVRDNGPDAMRRSVALRKACCALRKMEPLARALAGKSGWITGLRREQSAERAAVPLIDTSALAAGPASAGNPGAGLTKFNPLANWTWGDVWHYIACNDVDYNRLHDQFYPSIGCAPCTRAISLGEDLRSGRWWWENGQTKECGLHASQRPTATTQARAGQATGAPTP